MNVGKYLRGEGRHVGTARITTSQKSDRACLSLVSGEPRRCVLWKCHEARTCTHGGRAAAPAEPLSFAKLMELSYKAGCGVEHYGGDIAASLERFARAIEAAHGVKLPDGGRDE